MVVVCLSWNISRKIFASWNWVSSMAAAIPEILFVDVILWVIWGDMSTPVWLSACCFPASGAFPSTPVLTHFTIGGETSSLVAEQKMGSTTTCVMTQLVLLWFSVYGFYCKIMVLPKRIVIFMTFYVKNLIFKKQLKNTWKLPNCNLKIL